MPETIQQEIEPCTTNPCTYQLTEYVTKVDDLKFVVEQLGDRNWRFDVKSGLVAVFVDPDEFDLIEAEA